MSTSVHQEIKAELIRRLQALPLESRLPSDRDLAAEFNVAFLTINRLMRELEWEGYVVRRPRQGTFLASRERPVASDGGRLTGSTGAVAVVYPNFFSYHFWRHVRYAAEFALKNRLRLLEFKLNPDSTYERVLDFARHSADLRGLLLLPVPGSLGDAALGGLDALGCPVVLLSSHANLAKRAHLHCLNLDVGHAGRLVAEALIRKGHRKLAWVQNEPEPSPLLLKGMLDAMRAHGLRASDLACIGRGAKAWGDSREAGYRLTARLLDGGAATGVYYDSLAGAQGGLRALAERGLRAPQDLSLIAGGMQNGEEDYLLPPLTTVDWDWQEEMRLAFAIVLGRGAAKTRELLLPARITSRKSLAAPRPLHRHAKPGTTP